MTGFRVRIENETGVRASIKWGECPISQAQPTCLMRDVPNIPRNNIKKRKWIMLNEQAKQAVATELKRFAGELKLSDDQKTRLQTALENAREKIEEIRKSNPDMTAADVVAKLKSVRSAARERLTQFLTPDQLAKWDAEMAKAKSFLGVNT